MSELSSNADRVIYAAAYSYACRRLADTGGANNDAAEQFYRQVGHALSGTGRANERDFELIRRGARDALEGRRPAW